VTIDGHTQPGASTSTNAFPAALNTVLLLLIVLNGAASFGDTASPAGWSGSPIANVIPVVFSAAGRIPGVPPPTALAGAGMTGYGGYRAGPP
jgi:hypothetical protein